MSREIRISEPKASKCGTYTVRTMKAGNKILGCIETPKAKPGERPEAVFWAADPGVIRLSKEGRFLTVTQAYLGSLALYAVKHIGLRTDDGTSYQIGIEHARAMTSGGVRVALLDIPAMAWTIEQPPVHERATTLMAKMRIAGGRRKSAVTSAAK